MAETAVVKTNEQPKTMANMKSTGITSLLEAYRTQIQKAIPNSITPERIIQIATSVINQNPDIKKCTTSSIVGAVLQSAILGFDPTPALGLCAFIPRWNSKTKDTECQFMIEYQGYIALARNSGEITNVYAQVVCANDFFEYEYGLSPKLVHKPAQGERGAMKCAYAVWYFKDGTTYFEVMDASEIAKVRAKSQAASSEYSPWATFESEMWRKSVIRRSRKYVPLSLEVRRKLETDEAVIQPDMIIQGEVDLPAIEQANDNEPQAGKPDVKMPESKSKPKEKVAEKTPDKPTKCEVCGKVAELAYSDAQGIFVCVDCVTK
jgi:recombination protein RecT